MVARKRVHVIQERHAKKSKYAKNALIDAKKKKNKYAAIELLQSINASIFYVLQG